MFLTGLLVLVMPLTEHLWDLGHFLRGGSDVEFSLLAGLLFMALTVLAMHRSMAQPLFAGYLPWYRRILTTAAMARSDSPKRLRVLTHTFLDKESNISSHACAPPLRI